MSGLTRRSVVLSGGAALGLAACGNGLGGDGAAKLDARVNAARDYLASTYPGTRDLAAKAVGVLYVPLVTSEIITLRRFLRTGRPAHQRRDGGLLFGDPGQRRPADRRAQQYAHALFFMTPEALSEFRTAPGWSRAPTWPMRCPTRAGRSGWIPRPRWPR